MFTTFVQKLKGLRDLGLTMFYSFFKSEKVDRRIDGRLHQQVNFFYDNFYSYFVCPTS